MTTTNTSTAGNEHVRDQQRDVWNTFSGGWEKQDDFVCAWLRPVGTKLIEQADIHRGYVVLDAATGTGEPGLSAAPLVGLGRVIGTDISEQMVAIASRKAREKGITNYEARVANESALPFADGYFDSVVSRFGTIYFPEPAAGVRELVRVLKPGHRIALAAWAEPQKNPWATTASRVVNEMLAVKVPPPDAPGIFRHAAQDALSSLLEEARLHDIDVAEVAGTVTFASAEAYWEFITDVVAPIASALNGVDAEQRAMVKRAVLDAAPGGAPGVDIRFPWSAFVTTATK